LRVTSHVDTKNAFGVTTTQSYDQLIDDLGEFGMAASSNVTTTQSYDQLIDDLGEWGR